MNLRALHGAETVTTVHCIVNRDSRHQTGQWLCKEAPSLTRSLQTPCHPTPSWGSRPPSAPSDTGRPPVETHVTLIWCASHSGKLAHTPTAPLFKWLSLLRTCRRLVRVIVTCRVAHRPCGSESLVLGECGWCVNTSGSPGRAGRTATGKLPGSPYPEAHKQRTSSSQHTHTHKNWRNNGMRNWKTSRILELWV